MSDEIKEIKRKKMKELKNKLEGNKMTEGKPKKVNDETFSEFTSNNKKAVVDAWADWCAPCKQLEPVIEDLANDYQGDVAFGKLNVDENQETAAQYGIRSIPTLLFFKDGELVDQVTGAMPKKVLDDKIQNKLL